MGGILGGYPPTFTPLFWRHTAPLLAPLRRQKGGVSGVIYPPIPPICAPYMPPCSALRSLSVRRASAPSSPVGSRMRSLRSRKRRAERAKGAPKARQERAKGAPATRRLPPPLRGESDGVRYPGRPPSRIISQQSQNRSQQSAIWPGDHGPNSVLRSAVLLDS